MAERKFKGAPFGTQVARFDVSAIHPANKRIGHYTEIPYSKITNERRLGPGSYDVEGHGDFSEQSMAQRAKGPGWWRAQETARLAAIPHFLYREAWENKHMLKSQVGPASYRIADFIEDLQKKPGSARGVCNSREERFRNVKSITPGPGHYEGGFTWAALEKTITAPSMHLNSPLQRFPEGYTKDSALSPCTYSLKSSTDILLASGTSKRGPYDLFTGSRDKPIPGFFAVLKRVNQNSEESPVVGVPCGEEMGRRARRDKRNHSVFATLDQYPAVPTERIYHSTLSQCARSAMSPGPGWYDAVPPRSWPTCHTSAPFLCSAPRINRQAERQRNGNYNTVGPGRYNIEGTGRSKTANCAMSAFSSRTQRYLHKPEKDKYAQERLRAVNVPLERRNFLVPLRGNDVMTAT